MKQCAICGKRPVIGHQITYRGKLKKKGGVGRKVVRVNRRRFLPNLQPMTILLRGAVRHVRVCTACLRSGRAVKPPFRPRSATRSAVPP